MKKSLGRQNVGAGKEMEVQMHGFGSSNYNLDQAHSLTMSAGTLVPYYQTVMLTGSKLNAKLHVDVMTLPTIGPMFGRFKVQIDWFATPLSLFNGLPMVNEFNLGKNMDRIKFPKIQLDAINPPKAIQRGELLETCQINPSSRLFYNGIRYLGHSKDQEDLNVWREFNMASLLMDDDTYLRYYANPQEEQGVFIHHDISGNSNIEKVVWVVPGGDMHEIPVYPGSGAIAVDVENTMELRVEFLSLEDMRNFDIDGLKLYYMPSVGNIMTINDVTKMFDEVTYNEFDNRITFKKPKPSAMAVESVYCYKYSNISGYQVEPKAKRFKLEHISELRKEVLKASLDGVAYEVDRFTNYEPYKSILQYDEAKGIGAKQYAQEGLYCVTYQSDMFSNWVNKEYISGNNGINELTKIETDADGNFTIDQFIFQRKLYDALMRVDVAGGQIDDYFEVMYDYDRKSRLDATMYIGGLSKELAFMEITSNTGTEEQPLGTLAGKGFLTSKHKGGVIELNVDRPTLVKGYISIKPRVVYSQGNDWFNDLENWDEFHKPNFDNIGFQDLISDNFAAWDTEIDVVTPGHGLPKYKGYGKQPAWTHYRTTVDIASGAFAIPNEQMWQTLNRRYEYSKQEEGIGMGVYDFTAYIDPRKYNYVFANARRDAMNFQVNLFTEAHMRRKMAGAGIPNL